MKVKGHLELAVLHALRGKEIHGYRIVKSLQLMGTPELGGSEGTVYPMLQKLQNEGYVDFRWDSGKKLYRLSSRGEKLFGDRLKEWESLKTALDSFIGSPIGEII
jgi:PadR family transcriptional regulator PadR